MAARGDFQDLNGQVQKLDAAIFADTQSEPKKVMEWLDYLESEIGKQPHGFPLYRVTNGSLAAGETTLKRSKKTGLLYPANRIPAFVLKPDGTKGLLGRKCTSDFKIVPIQRKVKEICGVKRASQKLLARMWIGISMDESHRMKPSRVPYIENTWPLIDAGMTREDCLKWMADHGYPEPPRSACTFCPFHSDEEWQMLKSESPDEFKKVVEFERAIQLAVSKQETLKGVPFLHVSCQPIDTVDFSPKRGGYEQISLFGNECTGLCGV